MGALDGRVAIITGAGRGLGREHALLFAAEGAKVVVNDRGGANDGAGEDAGPATEVVAEIRAAGGEAISNDDDVADWDGAQHLINSAIEAFGDLDILVNNAGILRDRVLVNMSEAEWDDVIRVHLRGHFAPTKWAAAYWREEAKSGRAKPRNLVHTSSTSGLFSNPGQSNYGAAKTGIATFSQIIAKELTRYEVKSNCIAPGARTRLTLATPGLEEVMTPKEGAFDEWDPANVSPLVAFLSTADCPFNGETFFVQGGVVKRVRSWEMGETVEQSERWTVDGLRDALARALPPCLITTAMRELIVSELVTLDGVMEAPGGEPTHPHTGWVSDTFSPDLEQYKFEEVLEAESLLLGRTTYESFSGAWPTYEGPFADRMNAMPKHVVSTTLADPQWNSTVIDGGVSAAVGALKHSAGGPILVNGSATLVHALLLDGLVDTLRLMVFPVSIGAGLRVFPDEHVKQSWRLVEHRAFPNSVLLLTLRPVEA